MRMVPASTLRRKLETMSGITTRTPSRMPAMASRLVSNISVSVLGMREWRYAGRGCVPTRPRAWHSGRQGGDGAAVAGGVDGLDAHAVARAHAASGGAVLG